VVARDGADGVKLLESEFYVVRSVGRVVWCEIFIPQHTNPTAGADAAQHIGKYLTESVLHRRSSWLGLIIDVRQGPSVIGPVTRTANANVLALAERARKPMAVLTVPSRPIHAQYCELAAQHAPHFVLVTDSVAKAMDWMTAAR